jgi:mono/diheme cytochrome c family protein
MIRPLASALLAALFVPAAAAAEVNFRAQILPIFGKSCAECHNAPKKDASGKMQNPKGGLRMDAPSHLLKGGSSGAAVVPGDPDKSLIYERILLPPSHEDAMPPKGEGTPLTFPQIELIKQWIIEGAKFGDWKGSDTAVAVAPSPSGKPKTADPLAAGLNVPPEDAIKKLASLGVVVHPVTPDSKLLSVAFVATPGAITDKEIELLVPLAANINELDLSDTKITDAAMTIVGMCPRLTKLNISGTGITDAGIAKLKGCTNLDWLAAHSTAVSDGSVETLKGLRKLKNVFLWKTRVGSGPAAELQKALPGSSVNIQ